MNNSRNPLSIIIFIIALSFGQLQGSSDPLPSWNKTKTKINIINFVEKISDKKTQSYVPPEDRVATIDNDGTLWTSHPMYFQLFFAVDRVKELAKDHPEWKNQEPYQSILNNDPDYLNNINTESLMKLIYATHSEMTTEEFRKVVVNWLNTARHPRFNRPFTDLVFQPMIELIQYLKDNQFKVYIVSGGGLEFMRPWTEKVYGIPPENVIGSRVKTEFRIENGKAEIYRLPEIDFIDDKSGKPIAINNIIGKKPVIALGNSDGDLDMFLWTASGNNNHFIGIVHHTDAIREYAYDKDTPYGRLDKALIKAKDANWTVIDMKNDWKVIYPFNLKEKNQLKK